MQKVEGSSPFIRFAGKPRFGGAFAVLGRRRQACAPPPRADLRQIRKRLGDTEQTAAVAARFDASPP